MYKANLNFYFQRSDNVSFHIPFHTHKCYELVFYLSGNGYCVINNKKFNYEKNCFAFIPPNALHNDIHTEACKLICLGITIDKELPPLQGYVFHDTNHNIHKYLNFITQELEGKKTGFADVVNNHIGNILVEIIRKITVVPNKAVSHREMLSLAVKYIDEYFLSDITAEQLEEITNYSYHRFRHVFKDAMGLSPKKYIILKRIEHAKSLLSNSNESITKIGYDCGFPSTSHFIKIFRENTMITPKQYRAQLNSNYVFSDKQSSYNN